MQVNNGGKQKFQIEMKEKKKICVKAAFTPFLDACVAGVILRFF